MSRRLQDTRKLCPTLSISSIEGSLRKLIDEEEIMKNITMEKYYLQSNQVVGLGGFESPDSDFDVRFVYKRNLDSYLKLNPDRDVIEIPIDDTWGVCGWDLSKTLKLLYKSNTSILEWINSPLIYYDADFINKFRLLSDNYFSEKRMLYHHLNLVKSNVKSDLSTPKVKPKKYLYALRSILSCYWIKENHSMPPILFDELVKSMLGSDMKKYIDDLIKLKVEQPECTEIDHIKEIDGYIEVAIKDIDEYIKRISENDRDWYDLDKFFSDEVKNK